MSSRRDQATSWSRWPALSADGRVVTFSSGADNLVAEDTNRQADVFVRNVGTGRTTRVSVTSAGRQARSGPSFSPAISASGRIVTYESAADNLVRHDTNGLFDVFVRDRRTGTTRLVSVTSSGTRPSGISFSPDISADGRFIVFDSSAQLIPAPPSSMTTFSSETGSPGPPSWSPFRWRPTTAGAD